MPLVKVRKSNQVTIPKKLVEELGIKEGDYVELSRKGNKLYIAKKDLASIFREKAKPRDPKDWFKVGDKELQRAKNLLNLQDLEGAGVNIQQAVEKYLKGFLLSKGWELRRIHEVIIYDPAFEEFRAACQKMTDYYIEERYPFVGISELAENEVRESLNIAENMIARIKRLVS